MVDLIIALGGGDDRKQEAINLYNQGVGRHILFTGEPSLAQMYSKWGVGQEGVYTTFISTDTVTDVIQVRSAMIQNNFLSAIIVDSSFHLARTKMLFTRTFCLGVALNYITVPTPTTWTMVLSELLAYAREYFTVKAQC